MWKIWSANISQDNQSPCSWISVKMSHSPKYCIIIFLPEKKQVENWEDGEAWSSVDAKEQLCCVCFTSTHLHLLCCDSASQDIDLDDPIIWASLLTDWCWIHQLQAMEKEVEPSIPPLASFILYFYVLTLWQFQPGRNSFLMGLARLKQCD